MTAQQVNALFVKALGYTVEWADVNAKAEELKIAVVAADETLVLRGEAFATMRAMLDVPKMDETDTFGTSLGLTNYEPPTPPAPDAVVITNAVALNSKVIEVSLDSDEDAPTALTIDQFVVTDEDDAAVAVASVEFAGWDADMYTVLVTLEEDTTAGTLYTVTSGDDSANFGGRAADEAKPSSITVTPVDTYTFKVAFNEAVLLDTLALEVEDKNSGDELAVTNLEYASKTTITVTTAEQSAKLYEVKVTEVEDLAGNAITSNLTKTFVGIKMPTTDLTLSDVKAEESNKVIAVFARSVDAATALDIMNYTLEEVNTDTEIEVIAAEMNSDDSTTTAVDESKVEVVLTLADHTSAKLYKLTVKDVDDVYGNSLASNQSDTFVGLKKDETALAAPTIEATSNTTVKLTFADNVDTDTALDMFAIEDNNSGDELAITDISISKKVVTLTTAEQSQVLYKLTIAEGILDTDGNATEKDLVKTFVGKKIASKISSVSVTRNSTDTEIILDFNANVGSNATDVALYTINNDIGYPEKAEKVSGAGNEDKIKLTIPKTTEGKLYTVTVAEGILNSDGVVSTADVKNTFVGKGISATLPEIEAVMASDANTLKIYFDRDVTDSTIKGKVYNATTKVMLDVFNYENDTTTDYDQALTGLDTYQDPEMDNVLVVRSSTPIFRDADTSTSNNTFVLEATDVNVVKAKTGTTPMTFEFAYNNDDAAGITIQGISSLDNQTIRVYFDMPVQILTVGDFARVAKKADDKAYADNDAETIDLDSAVKADADGKEWDIKLNAAMDSTEVYELLINLAHDTGDITDLAGVVKLADQSTTAGFQYDPVEFAGTTTAPSAITGVYATMSDERTVLVHFPVDMDTTDVITDIYSINTTEAADVEVASQPLYRIYDADARILTIYLGQALATSASNEYFLEIEGTTTLKDAAGTRYVNDGKTTAGNLVVQFAESTTADAAPAVKSVSVADDRYSITITMTEDVVFADATNTDFGAGTDFVAGLDAAELLAAMNITAQFEGETSATDLVAGDITSITGASNTNEKTFVVALNKKLAVGSNGTVTTEGETASKITNRNAVVALVSTSATSVDYGVSASLYTDAVAPTTVVTAGDNGGDNETIAEGATVTIIFNETLTSAAQAVVEAAIVAGQGGDTAADWSFSWTGAILSATYVDDADDINYVLTGTDVTAANVTDGTNNSASVNLIEH
jgi:hypothetical protein